MSDRYRFSIRHKDSDINKIQKEIEDNFAPISVVNNKEDKVTSYTTIEPDAKKMSNGEKKLYYDGTNLYFYVKVNGKLFKSPAYTEV